MKTKSLIAALTIALLSTSCYDHNEYTVCGYLYSDSTKAEPLADATLAFYREGELMGTAHTDNSGFWGLWYKYTPETSRDINQSAKFQLAEWEMTITYNGDTLFSQYGHHFPLNETLVLYPDIDWQHYYDY